MAGNGKKVLQWGLLLLVVGLLVGCGAGKPTIVAKAYFEALEEGDWEEANYYVSIRSLYLFDEMQPYLKAGNQYTIEGYLINDDGTAIVQYKENNDPTIRELHLTKERGRWRVKLGDK